MPGAVRGGEPERRAGKVTPIAARAPRIGLDPHPADAQVPLPDGWYRGSTGLPLGRQEPGVATAVSRPARPGTWLERPTGLWPAQDEEGVTHAG
ncbi:hypothetical protein ACH4UM_22635 [Streptomyces sp. NPDC020801]|uniref:hypothetical protein n=1 Tax=unclassified Streptomyces TaxID=2593676 RepID=UPI00378F844D